MSEANHLLTVWNPYYCADALDQHITILLDWGERALQNGAKEEDVYVWWAKVRSPRRPSPLDHMEQILALNEQIAAGVETHLYVTDYQSLYVGWLAGIVCDNLRGMESEKDHLPSYYREASWPVDCWMKLRDIRCIVAHDTTEACREMGGLLNTRYDDKPVSIYGGMVDVPLIVRQKRPRTWFAGREEVTGGRIWARADAEHRGESSRLAKELRENLFGKEIWHGMEPETRRFLSAGEAVYRARREDPRFDFSPVVVEYAKAVETELHALLFPPIARKLADAPAAKRIITSDKRPEIDLAAHDRHETIGSIQHLLKNSTIFKDAVRAALPRHAVWLLERLPSEVNDLRRYRNPAAHDQMLARADVDPIRADVLGIGCEGLIVRIVKAKGVG
ncbi:MAG: hypothetical protein JW958_00180 [Candidatus Eisenbacteria bacterium]|nr:hypothetical protein [Candidatus Eisenbacteria bacterium]